MAINVVKSNASTTAGGNGRTISAPNHSIIVNQYKIIIPGPKKTVTSGVSPIRYLSNFAGIVQQKH